MAEELGITIKKENDMPEWYSQVVQKAELADIGPIKGFMIIRPNAYSIWESIQNAFNPMIKKAGVKNAYFPVLIPEKFFKKEADHFEGFAPELAWIEKTKGDNERYAMRPTSETVIYDSFSKWVRSHRDLPIKVNQWCNVLRWEVKQTKMFLRSREFLWQEGHCIYATKDEAEKEVINYLDMYTDIAENYLAISVIKGKKTEAEKFAGAEYTTTFEGLMPDGKALQMGTSHLLNQKFVGAFDVRFTGEDKKEHIPYPISWGISTRLIGAIIMVHGDDKGLIIPPRIAEYKAVIVPIIFEKTKDKVLKECKKLSECLSELNVFVDDREEYNPGYKYNHWELRGIPLRIELGPKDLEKQHCVIVRRDNSKKEFVKLDKVKSRINEILDEMHNDMYNKSKKYLESSIVKIDNKKDNIKSELSKIIKNKKMALIPFCGEIECEEKIKDETGASSRCIPFTQPKEKPGKCYCGKNAKSWCYFANSY